MGGPGSDRIVITPGQIDAMVAGFARTWQRPPTEPELKGLVDDYVREEMATREAVAIGLDRDDTIIRRRLRQKLEFLAADSVDSMPPTDAELQTWLTEHPDAFRTEEEVAFRQVYLNPERRGASIEADARQLLARLSAAGPDVDVAALGDPLMLPREVVRSTRSDVVRQFGDEFGDAIMKVTPGRWEGPLTSGYGLHLVFVRERVEGRMPTLAEVRPLVEREFMNARRTRELASMYERMLQRYRVTVEKRTGEPQTAGAARHRRGEPRGERLKPAAIAALALRDAWSRRLHRGCARVAARFSRAPRDRARDLQLPLEEAVRRRDRDLHRARSCPRSAGWRPSGQQQLTPGALIVRGTLTCEGGIEGKAIAIDGLESTITDVIVRLHHADGRLESHLLKPTNPSVTLGARTTGWERASGYVRLGIEHILLGVDHLLFVLGLLLIVGDRWMLLKTITAFTIAHSITLAIATLGYASAPIPPLNAAIALSILFLGPEIVRRWRGQTSFTIRHPWIVAFAFGLLHGFGFASGLTTMGLPQAEIPLALLLFNVGVNWETQSYQKRW